MNNYFLALLTRKIISAMIPTTTNTPTQTPALKMSPTNSQLLNEIIVNKSKEAKSVFFILIDLFKNLKA